MNVPTIIRRFPLAKTLLKLRTPLSDTESNSQVRYDQSSVTASASQLNDARKHYPARETAPDDQTLLQLCDDVRTSLREKGVLGPKGDEMMKVLGDAVKSECDGMPMISFSSIITARLDKLLDDMLNKDYHSDEMSVQFRAQLSIAESLQRQWRNRFREQYSDIDTARYFALTEKDGMLEDMVFNMSRPDYGNIWIPKQVEALSEKEGNDECKAGHWWLNLACAHRDGIVCSGREELSQAKYGIPTLPLLTGSEVADYPSATVTYTREGRMSDMCVPLMTELGKKIRILRGHRLKSPFAPQAGVRYDGQYIIRSYGQKLDIQTETLRLKLILERVDTVSIERVNPLKFEGEKVEDEVKGEKADKLEQQKPDDELQEYQATEKIRRASANERVQKLRERNEILELEKQPQMHEVMKIPRPSEVDDWQLFERFEDDTIKQRWNVQRILAWKISKAKEKAEMEAFKRTIESECATGGAQTPSDLK